MLPNKKKIGLFLAAAPHMGGIFQYGQTLLTSLANLPKNVYETTTICKSDEWRNQARDLGLQARQIPSYDSRLRCGGKAVFIFTR